MSTEDFFAKTQDDGPPRDRYGRPLLFPRGHDPECPECKGKDAMFQPHRRWYTRSSSLSDMLADFGHIQKWRMRYLARSMGYNRDLAMLAAAETYTTGFDKGDEKENRASGKRLDDIIERALDRQGISEKADYGTAVHAWTEPGNDGYVFNDAAADVQSFKDKVTSTGSVILGTELFTANDRWWAAGTFDHLMYVPGYGIVITDKKTSSAVHGHDFAIQLVTYAHADLYDWETDERMTLEEYIASLGWDPGLLNRDQALIWWIKDGRTTLHELDLVEGAQAADRAVWVRDIHRKGTGQKKVDSKVEKALEMERSALLTMIQQADSEAALTNLWNNRALRAVWTEQQHTQAAKARKESL